jgi:hypothetical protein
MGSGARFLLPLQNNFLRFLIIPPAEEHGLAQLASSSPFRKGCLANEFWLYLLDPFGNAGRIFEWRFVSKERLREELEERERRAFI